MFQNLRNRTRGRPELVPPQTLADSRAIKLSEGQQAVQLLKKLEFKVLRRLDGFLFGNYSGLFYGPSLDLAEVREYQPGDDVKHIDWNVTARTDKVHIRQYREEREILAWLVVDLSPSMQFGTRRVLKSELAQEFAGLASAVISRQGNKIGLLAFSDQGLSVVPLSSGRNQTLRILNTLLGHNSADAKMRLSKVQTNDLAYALRHASQTLKRRALVFVLSDFLWAEEDEPGWAAELKRLSFSHDVIAVRLHDPVEKALPKVGELRLRDPETGEEIWVDTSDKELRKAYKKLIENRNQLFQKVMKRAHVDVLELSTHEDIVGPILKFTQQRKARR
ncbi:MAG: DUF58 domain-containing protein [Trueperaceae bacterium]|nr:DUF58 domain-containing protein [Trueperaceae bacterium]